MFSRSIWGRAPAPLGSNWSKLQAASRCGAQAARIWAAALPTLAANDSYTVDVFSHLDRVREFCKSRGIAFREAAQRCLVLEQPSADQLLRFFERFEGETFGVRAGEVVREPDAALEGELSRRGLDAYQEAYPRYAFCAVCEPVDAWVTLLSKEVQASEVTRRLGPVAQAFHIYIARPH